MFWPRRVWWSLGDAAELEWPAECAACGASLPNASDDTAAQTRASREATASRATAPEGGQHAATASAGRDTGARDDTAGGAQPVYCGTCRREHARHDSTAAALGAVSLLFGIATALAFPLLWPRAALGWHLLAATTLAVLPIAGLGAARRCAVWGSVPRVWRLGPLGTCIERRETAARVAAATGRPWRSLWLPPVVYRIAWGLVPALAIVLSGLAYGWHHPRLRVINFTRERLWLAVDGPLVAALDPAGSEPARATLELRLPRGRRELVAFDEHHQPIARVVAELEGGREHLYAPASVEGCFWLESTGYGRRAASEIRPLLSETRFFVLSADVDTWFAETPEPPRFDRRSSGGTLTALRHAPCPRAPEAVRRTASAIGP